MKNLQIEAAIKVAAALAFSWYAEPVVRPIVAVSVNALIQPGSMAVTVSYLGYVVAVAALSNVVGVAAKGVTTAIRSLANSKSITDGGFWNRPAVKEVMNDPRVKAVVNATAAAGNYVVANPANTAATAAGLVSTLYVGPFAGSIASSLVVAAVSAWVGSGLITAAAGYLGYIAAVGAASHTTYRLVAGAINIVLPPPPTIDAAVAFDDSEEADVDAKPAAVVAARELPTPIINESEDEDQLPLGFGARAAPAA